MTAKPSYCLLAERGVLAVSGDDRRAFLQGLISNDIQKVGPRRVIHAAMLTPQGKYLHDFFVAEVADELLLDSEAARLDDLKRRLGLYRLRSKVGIERRDAAWLVAAAFGDDALATLGLPAEAGAARPFAGGIACVDPRLPALGARLIIARTEGESALVTAGMAVASRDIYERLRLSHGIPDGSRDLKVEDSILLENGFEELNGVDFAKGCYMGQELTARTKYRGLVKKRLLPVDIEGPTPPAGTPLLFEGHDVGEMRSALDGLGLALVRLDVLPRIESGDAALLAGDARLRPRKPAWAEF